MLYDRTAVSDVVYASDTKTALGFLTEGNDVSGNSSKDESENPEETGEIQETEETEETEEIQETEESEETQEVQETEKSGETKEPGESENQENTEAKETTEDSENTGDGERPAPTGPIQGTEALEDAGTEDKPEIFLEEDGFYGTVTQSGECGMDGGNLTWTFYADTRTLVISGEGKMKNYGTPPWRDLD